MRGFVASWFFPPLTSAEGLVTFKLLKASQYKYDVCSSISNKWSYQKDSVLESDNINVVRIETEEFDEWIEKSVAFYEKNKNQYKFIMTRSMPPESHKVGLEIKKKNPGDFWVASFGDPLSWNPYEVNAYVKFGIPVKLSDQLMKEPRTLLNLPSKVITPGLKIMKEMMILEKQILEQADMFIFPTIDQCQYTLGDDFEKYKDKCLIIPHTYDLDMFGDEKVRDDDKYTFTFIGHADAVRNPICFVHALKIIKDFNPELADKIRLRFVGNIPQEIKDVSYAFFLHNNVIVDKPVTYKESLKIMKDADCLLHIDGFFGFVPNGSIFFASKVADYMGARKPILGATSEGSPVHKILKASNNLVSMPWDNYDIAKNMVEIATGKLKVDYTYYENYNVKNVCNEFDKAIQTKKGNIQEVL